MGVPKHKVAKTKSRMRKSNSYYKVKPLAMSVCPNCGSLKLPHRVCPECGYYKGKQILTRVVQGE
ncbi:MAG: 50S ribosomal protein L32 [Brevinematia bacterium]